MAASKTASAQPLVLVNGAQGMALIPAATPLTRLNYFDGKFLRAQDLAAEQDYLRQLAWLGNLAGGSGVVHGLNLTLADGDQLQVDSGLAIDPAGRVLLLPQDATLPIAKLIESSRGLAAAGTATASVPAGTFNPCAQPSVPATPALPQSSWYLITVAAAEDLCGEESVYGTLCEQACVTSTDRPYRVEGVLVRANPLTLCSVLPTAKAVALTADHLRSRLASAYYADEAAGAGAPISAAVLGSALWCRGAGAPVGGEVPLGVLVREGGTSRFVDQWTARRERMDTPPKRYWQGQMAMRPWDCFMAQILQFQCQLRDALARPSTGGGGTGDPCKQARSLVAEAADHMERISTFYRETAAGLAKLTVETRKSILPAKSGLVPELADLAGLQARLKAAQAAFALLPQERQLIYWGIVELPSAGYLPVVPGDSLSVNKQVRRFLGDGLDLRFCVVRPDFVPHALEEAQHMERISLLQGLDYPNAKPRVDVLVPFGKIAPDFAETGRYYEMRLNVPTNNLIMLAAAGAEAAGLADNAASDANATNAGSAASFLRDFYRAEFEKPGSNDWLPTLEYQGAARSEQGADGSFAFYFAGTTGKFPFGRTRTTEPTTEPAPGTLEQPSLFGRLFRSDAASTAPRTQARSSLWSALTIAGDPGALAQGDSVRIWGEAIFLGIAETSTALSKGTVTTVTGLLTIGFSGELQVSENRLGTGPGEPREVTGVLVGELTLTLLVSAQNLANPTRSQRSYSLNLTESVRLKRQLANNGPAWQIDLPRPRATPLVATLGVRRDWTSPTEAEAIGAMSFLPMKVATSAFVPAASADGKVLRREAFHAWQKVNAKVREPRHEAHINAIAALNGIGAAQGGGGKFADLKARRLFPPAAPVGSELAVLATLDWVLFHRRRDKQCELDFPAVPIETRRYAVYRVALGDKQTFDALFKQLTSPGSQRAGALDIRFVQYVDFEAGIQAVATPFDQVQAPWKPDTGAGTATDKILGALVASSGLAEAEGDKLALARLEALVGVIDVVAAVDPAPDYRVLSRVPDALDIASSDGAMVVATRKAATNCHLLYGIANEDLLGQVVNGLNQNVPFARLEEALGLQAIGSVAFAGTEPNKQDLDPVHTAWGKLAFGVASVACVVAQASDKAADDYPQQAAAILDDLSGGAVAATPKLIRSAEQLPTPCAIVTLVAGK